MSQDANATPRLVALRHRDFRLYWLGQLFSVTGSNMQTIAVNWHVFQLLRDQQVTFEWFGRTVELGAEALGLGTLGLVRIGPIITFALVGGILADTRNRRRLLLVTESTAALLAATLAALTLTGRASLGALYLLTAILAATSAFDSPARQAFVPNLVPRAHLANALSINITMGQIATIAGPALAGILIARTDVGFVYVVNALSYSAIIVALLLIHYRGGAAAPASGLGWSALVEGLRFTFHNRLIWSTMLLDFFATLFSSARTMLPIIADDVLRVGADGYGWLATAEPAGAMLAGLALSLRREIRRQGRALLASVAIYGLATALFGVSTIFALSYALFALIGAGDTVSMVIRNTIRQTTTPDELRGRMTSVNMVFFMGGPQLGELEAGLVASAFGVPFAIFSGGLLTVLLTAWVAWKYPRLRNYEVRPEEVAAGS
jgi:MFS family permease